MSLSEEDQKTLTLFTVANNLMSFSIFHNVEMDLLFEFISPIMKPDMNLKEQAKKIASELDLVYTESKIISHQADLCSLYMKEIEFGLVLSCYQRIK
jgi:hypothetical protein